MPSPEPSARLGTLLPAPVVVSSTPLSHSPSPSLCPECSAAVLQVGVTFSYDSSRSGTFYLPSKFRGRAVPLMLAFHGLKGDGRGLVNALKVLPLQEDGLL